MILCLLGLIENRLCPPVKHADICKEIVRSHGLPRIAGTE